MKNNQNKKQISFAQIANIRLWGGETAAAETARRINKANQSRKTNQ